MSGSAANRFREGYDWAVESYRAILDPTLAPVHRSVVERATVTAGDQVLDLACGTGAIARLAAARGADVTGIDVSAAMIAAAHAASGRSLRFDVGDAARLPYSDGRFDSVLCGFGLSHLPDVTSALVEVLRVLRPGGRLVEASWGANGSNPAFSAVLRTLERHASGQVHAFSGLLDEDTWADPSQGCEKLAAVGFDEVGVVVERLHGVYPDAMSALAWTLAWPDYGLTAAALDAADEAQFRRSAVDAVAALDDLSWWFEINHYVACKVA